MKKNKRKKEYIPPKFTTLSGQDLNGPFATGQGDCMDGGSPSGQCHNGSSPGSGCFPGAPAGG